MKYTLDGQSLGPVLKDASDLDELRSMALYDGMLYVVRQTLLCATGLAAEGCMVDPHVQKGPIR
jgi:hypothetical protein